MKGRFLIGDRIYMGGFRPSAELLDTEEGYVKGCFEFLEEWEDEKEYVTAHTSGSTGNPKEIILRKQDMINSAQATGKFFGFAENDRHFCPLSAQFIAGKMMLVRSMEWNTELRIIPPSSNPLQHINSPYEFGVMTPHQLATGLDSPFTKNINYIENLLLGGSPVPPALESRIQDLNTNIYLGYGMTETMSHIALRKLNGHDKSDFYTAVDHVSFSTDSRSCLKISTKHLSIGEIQTNDIVELINPHQFHWQGRHDFVINSGGIKLFPEQIEKKLSPFIAQEFYVIGEKDERYGEIVVLKIKGSKILDIEELTQSNLSKYEIPKKIIYLAEFEYTKTGKLIRK